MSLWRCVWDKFGTFRPPEGGRGEKATRAEDYTEKPCLEEQFKQKAAAAAWAVVREALDQLCPRRTEPCLFVTWEEQFTASC